MFLKKKRHKLAHIPAGRLLIRAITLTNAGCVRQNNEDCATCLFMDGSKTNFFAILADGMGGYERGEVASALMVKTVCDDNGRSMNRKPKQWLAAMIDRANSRIYECTWKWQSVMGTTCSMLLIRDGKAWCAHIGDSRIYLMTDGVFRQLTADHTVVMEMLRKGRITAAEAAKHPQRNILTTAVGISPHVIPDIFRITDAIRAGSRFLLCSDGLYDMVADAEIRRMLEIRSLKAAATALVDSAIKNGGYDNVTVTLVEINEKTDTDQES
jgi:protein phosphatase